MNYEQTLEYLFEKLPMFSRIGAAAYKADLANTIRICQSLDQPQNKFKTVHIAGTNGKGSVSHMLAAIFHAAGYKTGLYTSPHLKDFRERIKVSSNGEGLQEISQQFIVDFTEKIKPLIAEIEPSFFEITVGMAFDYFRESGVDIAIIETGLGGRLDSTNVVFPELSVITNIGMDHMNILGDSLEKIAGEKAGIIKEKIPVVIGEVLPQTISVFEATAKEKNAPLHIASKKRQAVDWKWKNHELIVEVAEEHVTDHKIFHLDLPGIYQLKNLITVLESCYQLKLKGWNLQDEIIHKALRQVKKLTGLHGRWDIIHQHPTVVLDVAHNQDGINQLLEQIEVTDHHRLHLITGFVKDKEVDRILSMFPKNAEYYFTQANIPRAMESATLLQRAQGHGLNGRKYPDVNTALKDAIAVAGKDDLIIVCGSVFLVGEVQIN
ncbi:MAG: bifunctional folylpolyglutamate synthase/dihydrofolate synthase [Bacteroidetes bacterium]|nr:MAG: bifunctional folylpolyglutamate synthase/dihydrofolate synthase [Bacteroidota bacterium]